MDELEAIDVAFCYDPVKRRILDGASFVFGIPEHVPALWGDKGEVLWAEGEALMLVGPEGVGKGTLLQQLALARIGISQPTLLERKVRPAPGPVLYLAMDRPRQIASSLRRMVDRDDEEMLRERLHVWRGPLPVDIVAQPSALSPACPKTGR